MRCRAYRLIVLVLTAMVLFAMIGVGAAGALISTTEPQLSLNH